MADPLDALRALMASHSPPLRALIVPSEDSHQSEYVSARDQRRAFVSGFTGSAGLALITSDEAFLWTDGRYFLQATQQLSKRWMLKKIGEDPAVENWISDNLPQDAAIGVNPWCISVDTARRWESVFFKKNQKLVQLTSDLVDEVWKDRPEEEILPVSIQHLEFSGRSVSEKLGDLRDKLTQMKAYALIITALDEVAWLYNIRGNDVAYCPVVHAYAIVSTDSAFLYVDKRKLSDEVIQHISGNGISIREYSQVDSDVSVLASGKVLEAAVPQTKSESNAAEGNDVLNQRENGNERGKMRVTWIDPSSCCFFLYSKFLSDRILLQPSPLALSKALKNNVELEGLRKSHERDGAAVVQFLAWLDDQMQQIYGASGYFSKSAGTRKKENSVKLTEVSVSDKLEEFRSKQEHFKGLSFPTISSVGPNAAVIHYKPKSETCSELDPDSIYLFDSGAQYQDGTTDVTRTVHFGKPSDHEKTCYTAIIARNESISGGTSAVMAESGDLGYPVLKGHIALDIATFPNGTTGHALDILARTPLWKHGLDYRHGTGHGVGSYLLVHEGPHLISFRPYAGNVALQVSMTVTNEPGYYEDGSFGIRLENVLIVKEASTEFDFGDKGYLSFEHITWVPYQTKMIDLDALTPEEIQWVDQYHERCREILAPYLNEEENGWLKRATELITA